MSILYDFVFLIFALLYLPYFLLKKKFHKGLWQRFGFCPTKTKRTVDYRLSTIDRPIWIHAVSVGEVAGIKPFWERLREDFPSKKIAVSTITKTGNELAKKFSRPGEMVFYLPLDFSFIVNSILRKIKPALLIIAETEIWPNLIRGCCKKNIPIILVNGRISDRAFRKYRFARPLVKGILEKIDIFCVRSEQDRKRFVFLGAPCEKVKTVGNMKYCSIKGTEGNKDAAVMRNAFGIKDNALVFTAGSTHKGEEEIILEVFDRLNKEFSNLHLIIAPRHIERAGKIKRMVAEDASATIIDRIGVLNDLYSISDVVFIGGSLVAHGGHNIIEPAIFEKPILFGPYMSNFKDVAEEFLKNDAAIMVSNKEELELNCRRLLSNEKEKARLGQNAKKVVLNNQGAVEKTVAQIKRILGNA